MFLPESLDWVPPDPGDQEAGRSDAHAASPRLSPVHSAPGKGDVEPSAPGRPLLHRTLPAAESVQPLLIFGIWTFQAYNVGSGLRNKALKVKHYHFRKPHVVPTCSET